MKMSTDKIIQSVLDRHRNRLTDDQIKLLEGVQDMDIWVCSIHIKWEEYTSYCYETGESPILPDEFCVGARSVELTFFINGKPVEVTENSVRFYLCGDATICSVDESLEHISNYIDNYEIEKCSSNIHLLKRKIGYNNTKSARKTVN